MSFHRGWDLLSPALGADGGWKRIRYTGARKSFYFVHCDVEFRGEFHEKVLEIMNADGGVVEFDFKWFAEKVTVKVGGNAMELYA